VSQHAEPSPYSRSAIIADLAGVISEVAVLQERQAALNTATAAVQGRLAEMVRTLSQSTAISSSVAVTLKRPLTDDDVRRMKELLKRAPGASSSDVTATTEDVTRVRDAIKESLPAILERSERTGPAIPDARPPGVPLAAQDEGRPENARKASDDRLAGVSGDCKADRQSEESRHVAGAGGESAASADTAPAADVKPKRIFQQPLQKTVVSAEPRKVTAGGGLVQGGPVPKRPYIDGTIINLVIERYHAESEAAGDIDTALNLEPGTARFVIDEARMKRDERVQEADRARSAKLDRETAPRERPPAARPTPKPEPVKVSTPLPLDFGECAPAGATDPVIIVDKKGRRIIGPTGEWKSVTGLVADCLGVLADGEMRGVDRMLRACSGFTKDTQIVQCLPNWKVSLARIGIDLVHIKGIGVRLNRAKVAA
jgi:hypothetical protein